MTPEHSNDEPRLSVFVHLARDKDVDEWRAARAAGSLIGINDETPYGYGRAEHMGCTVVFSRSHAEGFAASVLRLGLRVILGFDVVHAWRQRVAMRAADVVWTHTESQYLAVAAVLGPGPVVIGQSVWLLDQWAGLGVLRRAFFRRLIQRIDVLTFLSEDNAALARAAFPDKRIEQIPFGIPSETRVPSSLRPGGKIRILALGNDRHRDWATLIAAARGCDDIEVAIYSGSVDRRLANGVTNVSIGKLGSNAALVDEMARATLMCVPLKQNYHASGITVVEEAVLMGVPVVATDTGGLRGYFDDAHVRYVPAGDPIALRAAWRALAVDPAAATALATRAQDHIIANGPDAERYVRAHVDLSRSLLRNRLQIPN